MGRRVSRARSAACSCASARASVRRELGLLRSQGLSSAVVSVGSFMSVCTSSIARRASEVVQSVAVATIWPSCLPAVVCREPAMLERSKMSSLVNEQADWSSLSKPGRGGTIGRRRARGRPAGSRSRWPGGSPGARRKVGVHLAHYAPLGADLTRPRGADRQVAQHCDDDDDAATASPITSPRRRCQIGGLLGDSLASVTVAPVAPHTLRSPDAHRVMLAAGQSCRSPSRSRRRTVSPVRAASLGRR